jgi:hypothetical protein
MNPTGLALRLFARTFWTARTLVWLVLALASVLAGAWLESQAARGSAADRSLLVIAFGLVIPIFAYVVFQSATNGQRLDRATELFARYGVSRRRAVLGAVGGLSLGLAAAGALLAGLAVVVSRGVSDPALGRDLFASASIGALAGCAYSSWLALGSSIGSRGGGRKWVLAFDFILGSGSGPAGVLFPRAQLRNLLGAEPPLGLSQGAGGVVLLASALMALLVAIRRTPD